MSRLPRRALVLAVVAGVLLYLAAGWLLAVRPQHAKAALLGREIADARQAIVTSRSTSLSKRRKPTIRVADIFRLNTAVPDQPDMPGVILDLSGLARASGLTFEAITPGAPIQLASFTVVPIDIVVDGNFYDLSDFLYRMRHLVTVRHGRLDATGRLLVVESLSLGESPDKFPQIQATMKLDAFVAPAPVAPAPAGSAAASTATTPLPAGASAVTAVK